MKYFVIGTDGNKYGPFDVKGLKDLSIDGRVLPESILIEEDTGNQHYASSILDFMPPIVSDIKDQAGSLEKKSVEDKYNVYLIVSFVLFFFFPPVGIVFGAMAMKMEREHNLGTPYGAIAFWLNTIVTGIFVLFILGMIITAAIGIGLVGGVMGGLGNTFH